MANFPGTPNVDNFLGTPDDDTMTGLAKNDTLDGAGGNDTIDGGAGDDILIGGTGNDTFVNFVGKDTVNGGDDVDTITLSATSTTLNASADNKVLNVEAISAAAAAAGVIINLALQTEGFTITGGNFADTITGGQGADAINAGAGNDTINGFTTGDTVDGGGGNDFDTIALTATSTGLNAAADGDIVNIDAISAAAAKVAVTINLSNQSDGFIITGTKNADNLTGSQGDDTFVGFVGADTINGGVGEHDTIKLTATSTALNTATDGALSGVEIVTAAGVNSSVIIDLHNQSESFTIVGGNGGDTITGSSSFDSIQSGGGNDIIKGFTTGDFVDGGAGGNDQIQLTATSTGLNVAIDGGITGIELVTAATATAGVTIDLSAQTEAMNITGSGFADVITGTAGVNIILAGNGNDTINGFAGADTVNGGNNIDTLVLTGTSADLNAATNAQLVGVEAVSAAGLGQSITINLSSQTEGFTITGGDIGDEITGGAGADIINTGDGDDTVRGMVGADTINGGIGTDTIKLTATSTALNAATDIRIQGIEQIDASGAAAGVTINLALQTEGFMIAGSNFADVIGGSQGADTFALFAGADIVDGNGGLDTILLMGTSTNLNNALDTAIVEVEVVSADISFTGVTIDLHNQTEGFTIIGSEHADTITGGAGADIIDGGQGTDTINGMTVGDLVDGGADTDTIAITATSAALNAATNAQIVNVENISAAGAAAGVTISLLNQTEGFTITGSAFADFIRGTAAADTINAGAGNDTIVGFVGADSVDGGNDFDTIVLTGTSTALNAASDGDITNVEVVSAADDEIGVTINLSNQTEGFRIIGGLNADTITGSGGNDTIVGFVGADTVSGGAGDDTIELAATSSDLNNASDGQLNGIDVISAAAAAAGVTINLSNQDDSGYTIIGSAFADDITGSNGGDVINAGAGNDTIRGFGDLVVDGGADFDTVVLSATSTYLNSSSDSDIVNVEAISAAGASGNVTIDLSNQTEGFTITGSGFDDSIAGTAAADTINAGAGNDTIFGFAGADTVNGGADNDTIDLSGTSTALNAAIDAQIVNVEVISAAGASSGVTINLSNQTEGFKIDGTNYDDVITGGAGADIIAAAAGNDTINGFVGADTVFGGDDYDKIVLTATSTALNAAVNGQIDGIEEITASGAAAGVTIDLHLQSEGFIITGSAFADNITGTNAVSPADVINAGAGNDIINGFVGPDQVDGGADFDTIVLSQTNGDLSSVDDEDVVNVEAISALNAGSGVSLDLSLQSDGFIITGSNFDDTLTGSDGNDTFVGWVGLDTVDGGAGSNDTLVLSVSSSALNTSGDERVSNIEFVTAAGAASGVTIVLSNQTEGFTITGSAFGDDLVGGLGDDVITGGAGNDLLTGATGNDTFNGFQGADTIVGGDGTADQIVLTATSSDLNNATDGQISNVEIVTASSAGAGVTIDLHNQTEGFTIIGSDYNDSIFGGAGADHISAGAGNDNIVDFIGADVVDGGADNDTIALTATSTFLNNAGNNDIVNVEVVSAAGRTNSVTIDLHNQTEGFTIVGGIGGDDITGSSGADTINAGSGNDTIRGFSGADTVDSGADIDTIVLTGTSTELNAAGNSQIVNVEAVSAAGAGNDVTIDLHNQTEGFTITGSDWYDNITGTAAADIINGGASNDTIHGFDGADTVDGGSGTGDTIVLTASSTSLNSATNAQIVNVEAVNASGASSGVTVILSNQTEGFTITGSAHDDSITGGGGADVILAGDGNDTINGFVGSDTVDGGANDDTIVLTATSTALNFAGDSSISNVETINASGAGAGVTISISMQTESMTVIGSEFADTITGGAGNDGLFGGAGNDTFNGFVGGDAVTGGADFDTIALTATSANLNAASDAAIDTLEAVSAAGAGAGVTIDLHNQTEAFTITGGGFNDAITGTAAADTINAGGGNDAINGFAGADTVDGGAGGNDSIVLTATSSDLNSAADNKIVNVEVIDASTAAAGVTIDLSNQTEGFKVLGGDHDDTLVGSSGNDILLGGTGNDTLEGGAGNDTINGSVDAGDTVTYVDASAGVTVDLAIETAQNTGGAGTDTITLMDNLTGSAFDDNLHGNSSDNLLEGGDGNDTFVFKSGDGHDTISDFVAGAATDDVLDLRTWGFTSTAQVLGLAANDGDDVLITFNAGNTLRLTDVQVEDLHANDFLLT